MTIATLLFALIALPNGAERSGEPIMLDFTAAWCGPCRTMKPAVEQLAQKGIPIKPVDVDQSPDVAERYKVSGVPCFVVIDPADGHELARSSGAQPAANLVNLYRQAKAKYQSETPVETEDREQEPNPSNGDRVRGSDEEAEEPALAAPNPKPWETVVRIKVHGQGFMGFGSGTIIHSSPNEAIILTCAHIFKIEGRQQQPHPSRFPQRITIDLFDGKLTGQRPAQVHYANESFEGQALDYNFNLDVGLIRIRPGRRLPYAKVVPPHWAPKTGMWDLVTVGCSEGHDATAWSTKVVNPAMKGLNGNGSYEAIVCTNAPKQGRSGGGLFTSDGYIAGVCDFAEPTGNHGLYASPSSIYKILDRNRLTALYNPSKAPGGSDRLLAENQNSLSPRRPTANSSTLADSGEPQIRGQSPDREDALGSVTLPPPEMLNIKAPVIVANGGGRKASNSGTVRRQSWHASPSAATPPALQTDTVEMKLDPSLDPDRFDAGNASPVEPEGAAIDPLPTTDPEPSRSLRPRNPASKWKAGRTALPAMSGSGVN